MMSSTLQCHKTCVPCHRAMQIDFWCQSQKNLARSDNQQPARLYTKARLLHVEVEMRSRAPPYDPQWQIHGHCGPPSREGALRPVWICKGKAISVNLFHLEYQISFCTTTNLTTQVIIQIIRTILCHAVHFVGIWRWRNMISLSELGTMTNQGRPCREKVLFNRVFLKMQNPLLWAGLQNPIVFMYKEPKYQIAIFFNLPKTRPVMIFIWNESLFHHFWG